MVRSGSYFKGDSIDSQSASPTTPQCERYHAVATNEDKTEAATEEIEEEQEGEGDEENTDNVPMQREHHQRLPLQSSKFRLNDSRPNKSKRYAHQKSILKNSQDHNTEEQEILEAKKQLILRRRRLFSHYRQYEQWRRRQFSYDPSYFRANPLPIGQAACGDYYSSHGTGVSANRRRRQYRRQFSCAERSREGSRDSRESSTLQKGLSMAASDTLNTDFSTINQYTTTTANAINNKVEHVSFDNSEFGAHLHSFGSRHFHMLHEERSTSISERCTRSRINSAIFVSSEGRGFDSIEFLRRHGSQSVLCRKARSAENITDGARKKSFSDQNKWRPDEYLEETANSNPQQPKIVENIEMKESRFGGDVRTLSVLNSNVEQTSASVTTGSNVVVGSISIEAPPSNLVDEENPFKTHTAQSSIGSTTTASHDSTDTVEELIPVVQPAIPCTAAAERKSRLVSQRSSTASPIGPRSQSPNAIANVTAAHANPKALSLKGIKLKTNSNLPKVSVSGPSPQDEKPECL